MHQLRCQRIKGKNEFLVPAPPSICLHALYFSLQVTPCLGCFGKWLASKTGARSQRWSEAELRPQAKAAHGEQGGKSERLEPRCRSAWCAVRNLGAPKAVIWGCQSHSIAGHPLFPPCPKTSLSGAGTYKKGSLAFVLGGVQFALTAPSDPHQPSGLGKFTTPSP